MASDSSNLVRLQGVFVSDKELEALVSFWRAATPAPTPDGDVVRGESEGIPWIEQDVASEEDPLLKEAKHIVAQAGHASVSLLQRKLRIGYARAARLIDIMEAQGFISGPVDGGRVREVFLTDKEKPQSPSA
jgi:S-DNA-T family DNA segregation ATPase FtsK/SpoIIIE